MMPCAKRGRHYVEECDTQSSTDGDEPRVKRLCSGLVNVDEEDAPLALNKMFAKRAKMMMIVFG